MTKTCNKFHTVVSGEYCSKLAQAYRLSLAQLYWWNPIAAEDDCRALQIGEILCVGVIGSTVTSTKPTITSSAITGPVTPEPTQEGMVAGCKKFYLVQPGDGCIKVAQANGISWPQFRDWNKGVGTDCRFLQLGVFYCVGV
jgi:LysM repeat protein